MAFCAARLQAGTEMVLEVTGFDARLQSCDLVLTGEGRIDGQTTRGKVVAGVARRGEGGASAGSGARRQCGRGSGGAVAPGRTNGRVHVSCRGLFRVEEAMRDGYRLLADAAERTMRLLGTGDSVC